MNRDDPFLNPSVQGDPSQGLAMRRIHPVLQRIWVRSQMKPWTTLALVGSSIRNPDGLLQIAKGLAKAGMESGGSVGLIDGRTLELKHLPQVQARLRGGSEGKQTIVILALPKENPVTVSVAQSVDACILSVSLGETSRTVAAQTIEQIGRERFLGTVILEPSR